MVRDCSLLLKYWTLPESKQRDAQKGLTSPSHSVLRKKTHFGSCEQSRSIKYSGLQNQSRCSKRLRSFSENVSFSLQWSCNSFLFVLLWAHFPLIISFWTWKSKKNRSLELRKVRFQMICCKYCQPAVKQERGGPVFPPENGKLQCFSCTAHYEDMASGARAERSRIVDMWCEAVTLLGLESEKILGPS